MREVSLVLAIMGMLTWAGVQVPAKTFAQSPQVGEQLLWSEKESPLWEAVEDSLFEGTSSQLVSVTPSQSTAESVGGLTWNKGKIRVVPYGVFWTDMTYATSRTFPGAFTLFVFSDQEQGEGEFSINVRRSRFGLDVVGPRSSTFGGAENAGKIEIDFQGEFVTENRAAVLLRQCYWEMKNQDFRILVGQTWDVISPLLPNTVNYATGYFAGNLGFRRTQLRAERYFEIGQYSQLTLQGSLNQDIVADFPAEPGVEREASDWPVIEARAAIAKMSRQEGLDDTTLGFSGHIGETGFDFNTVGPPPLNLPPQDDARFKTWSFNADLYLPFTRSSGLQGEFFYGANLSPYLGGIGQGVCACRRVPIRSLGGWGELWHQWTPKFRNHIGFGVDDPNENDSLFGRSYNQFIYVNAILDINDQLSTGLEVTYWKTLYHDERAGLIPADELMPTEPGKSVTIDWMVKYAF